MTMARRSVLYLSPLLLLSAQEPPRIRVDVNLVNVSFTVRDSRGALAANLTADDFEVFEDRAAQKISFFARSADLPLSLGLIADFSGSQARFLKQHHRDLEVFLDRVLGPRDRVFLTGFGNRIRLLSDFSPTGASVVEALTRFERGDRGFPELGPRDEERDLGTALFDAVYYSTVEKLSGADRGRRALIVFSDGEDNSSAHHMMDVIESAQTADAPIFGIRYTERRRGRFTARNKYGIRVLERIARETGGADFDAEKADVATVFRQIGEELRTSYELAYTSTNPDRDGAFRQIVIRPKRSDLKVRAKTGYFAR
jgi:Ca-activated chloride channel homolog